MYVFACVCVCVCVCARVCFVCLCARVFHLNWYGIKQSGAPPPPFLGGGRGAVWGGCLIKGYVEGRLT